MVRDDNLILSGMTMASDVPALILGPHDDSHDMANVQHYPLRLSCYVRAFALVLMIALFVVIGSPLQWISLNLRLFPSRWLPQLFHRLATSILGINIVQTGNYHKNAPCLIMSNHVSWSDILVMGACGPMRFIAKSEVASWPLFGFFARLQRTIFVERGKRSTIPRVNQKIAEAMAQHDPIVLFAEATSSNGTRIHPFRSSHARAAAQAAEAHPHKTAYIQPVAIYYRGRWGMPLGRHERADIAWYGDMDLVPHIWSIICQAPIECHISFGEPIACHGTTDMKALTAQAEKKVRDMIVAIRTKA
jgi:lyso-ornithine lipid O-acyltransferase